MAVERSEKEQLARPFHRKSPYHHRVNKSEDGGVGPDAQRQRQHSDSRESRVLTQGAKAIAKVLSDLLKPNPAPGAAGFFFEIGRIAEGAHGGISSFVSAHARIDVLGDLLVEMELDLGVELPRVSVAPE